MKKIGLLFFLFLFLVVVAAVVHPLSGAGKSGSPFLERTEILDQEGRVLFRMEKRARVYYMRPGPLPPKLRPYTQGPLSGPPPFLVASDLSPEEARDLQGLSGVLVEEYFRPILLGGKAFEGLLPELFYRENLEGRRTRLTLSWDLQESLYRTIQGKDLLGGAVVELSRGEVWALVPGKEDIFLRSLFRIKTTEGGTLVFGRATGLEIPEALGVYWPGGEVLATPLQLARALAARFCGRPPEWHLLKKSVSEALVCRPPGKIPEKEYTYQEKGRWLRIQLFPEGAPRLALLLLGEGEVLSRVSPELEARLRSLGGGEPWRQGPGLPDLRGASLRAALGVLKPHGVKVEFQGFGRVVQQWPAPGTPWSQVKRCRLVLRDET